MSTSESPPGQSALRNHRSFLLRCWRDLDTQDRVVWRFSIRTVGDESKEQTLRSLGQLVDFLLRELFASKPGEE
ncbi:MAG: hypothetical protein R2867_24805 [Caldilineaceae bacterium]